MTSGESTGPRALEREPEFGRDALIVCDNLLRVYQTDTVEVQALQGLDLLVYASEMVAIVGASGSGKSTLLQVLAGVDAATAGRARVAGHDLLSMTRRERVHYRRHVVGFVRQQSMRNLVPYLTARQVVDLPLSIAGVPRRERQQRVTELFETLGLVHCGHLRPHQMSGGEQQRVAICVALANRPSVLLTDEPTGELDSVTAQEVFAALRAANHEWGTTIVIVTHDANVSGQVARTVAIRDGRTSSVAGELIAPALMGALAGTFLGLSAAWAMFGRLSLERITGQLGPPQLMVPSWALLSAPVLVLTVLVLTHVEWRRLRHVVLGELLRGGRPR